MINSMVKVIVISSILFLMSIGLFADSSKSVGKAMLYSAILPGAGQLYAENQNSAGVFLATEALLWFGKNRFDNEKKWTENSYKQFAVEMAGANPNTKSSQYNVMQGYMSSDDYNNEVILAARNYFLLIYNEPELYEQYLAMNLYTEDEAWDWKSNEDRLKFKEMRNRRQKYMIYSNFTFGSLLINRLISVVDAAKSTRKYNRHHVYTAPDIDGKGISLHYEFRF
ncbi:MAG: hypothetical protein RBS16_01845 [Candidatus Cloacimonadales bacterium]|jgi:hypothetical protein|nr:hypothetical protein [Candidatus Cloacimonadales bacterium]